eukprot:CAMPEP_0114978740 /NCGR_PEP_ID=MMETSP0216-20121206/3979_1 /TAXON_ID=223996 /ORGANISM="Protocruzia adherens, Strain Boccale" /LENGTH=378 /DNA_ID=CAMNT_0002339979 /DNA_START=883 /DNA_END=2019 /DNA_ORIENTATION=+
MLKRSESSINSLSSGVTSQGRRPGILQPAIGNTTYRPLARGNSFILSSNNNLENTRSSKRSRVKSSIGLARQQSLIIKGKENSPFLTEQRSAACEDYSMELRPFEPTAPIDLNTVVNECYGSDIESYLKKREKIDDVSDSLGHHKVSPQLRAKMVDWMIEVLTNFNCEQSTFFLSVQIMDQYLTKTEKALQPQDIHLLGVTCMFIASKYEDYYPLKMSIIFEKIGHRKLSRDAIRNMEREVLQTLDYNICCPTVLERMEKLCMDFMGSQDRWAQERVKNLCIFLAKAAKHDYESNCFRASTLGTAVVFLAFKMFENAFKASVQENWEGDLLNTKEEEEEVSACCHRLYNLSQNFDSMFPGLENLKRNHKFNFPTKTAY